MKLLASFITIAEMRMKTMVEVCYLTLAYAYLPKQKRKERIRTPFLLSWHGIFVWLLASLPMLLLSNLEIAITH